MTKENLKEEIGVCLCFVGVRNGSPDKDLAFFNSSEGTLKCSFSISDSILPEASRVDLSGCLEGTVIQLRKEVPLEIVVNMFQKLVCLLIDVP